MRYVLLFIFLIGFFVSSKGQLSFKNPVYYPYQGDSQNLVKGDFDGDGFVDLAFSTEKGNAIYVFYNLGTGEFSIGNRIDVNPDANILWGTFALPLDAADFNKDGKIDIVSATNLNGASTVQLFLSAGRSFIKSQTFATDFSVLAIRSSDLNLDGFDDFILALQNNTFQTFLADGRGGFTNKSQDLGLTATKIVIVDMNQDGNPDLVFDGYPSKISILFGDGHANFTLDQNLTVSGNTMDMVVGDFSGDGRNDIVANVLGEQHLDYFVQDISGHFSVNAVPTSYLPYPPFAQADIDDDGKLDIITNVINGAGQQFAILKNLGSNSFSETLSAFHEFPPFTGLLSLDVNNDQKEDIVGLSNLNSLVVYNNQGMIPLHLLQSLRTGLVPTKGKLEDLNSDGVADIITDNNFINSIGIMYGKSDGQFEDPQFIEAGNQPTDISVEDFNGDSKVDIIYSSNDPYGGTNQMGILFNDSNGKFLNPTAISNRPSPWIGTGDFNNDGNNDFVIHGYYYLGNGSGGFMEYPFSSPFYDSDATLADLDQDGKEDLIISHQNTLSIFPGNGSGFSSSWDIATTKLSVQLSSGDLNNDLLPDIIVSNDSGFISLFINQGNGSFVETILPVDGYPRNTIIADVSMDGLPDIVVPLASEKIAVFTGNPNHVFSLFDYLTQVNSSTVDVAVADLNYDQKPDILSFSSGSAKISVNYNDYVIEPTTAETALTFTDISDSETKIKWNGGDGSGRLAVMREGSITTFPTDGVFYSPNSIFSNGADLGSSSFVVYADAGESVLVTGLKPNTTYSVTIFDYNSNDKNTVINYLTSTSASGQFTTQQVVAAITETNDISFFPNPVQKEFKILNNSGNQVKVELSDMNGKSLLQVDISSPESVIDLSSFGSSLFILKMQTNGGLIIKKLIKL